jgi:large-conductance mechanosensitive channel
MIALWLIEFLLIALIVIALAWAVQQMIARARSRERAQSYAQDLLRYDEARQLVLQ